MKTISLTQGKMALIDDEDFDRVSAFKWYYSRHGYAVRSAHRADGNPKRIYLHRFVVDAPDDMVVDHMDGNTLNDQRHNLRMCAQSENQRNQRRTKVGQSSKYKGVDWNASRKKWRARIVLDGKSIMLGRYDGEVEAARAYNAAALKYFGAFAALNEVAA